MKEVLNISKHNFNKWKCFSKISYVFQSINRPLFRSVDLGRLRARPVDSCKEEGQKGALATVSTPTLKSASKKHQNYAPPYRSTACGTLKVVKKETVYSVYFSS